MDIIFLIFSLSFVGLFILSQHQVRVAQKNCAAAIKTAEDWQRISKRWEQIANDTIKQLNTILK